MQIQSLGFRVLGFILGAAVLAFSGAASADPPSRVARLGYIAGAVSFSPAGENDWVQARVNRPLTNGDRLWVDAGARAEIQSGGAMIRMNDNTSVSILNIDNRITQLQLTQGTLNVRVRRLALNQVFEVDTPNLAFTLRQPGEYRIAVDPDGNATDVIVRKGQGEVLGEGAAYVVDSRQPYRFMGTGLREYEYLDVPRLDEFDRWASDRDRAFDNSASARYVSGDVVGYQDLDANGTWRVDATYGNVWLPNRVASDWAPYRDGHWAWIDPWGWTWIDDAPWGFAVSHYGRWANLGNRWGWVPGPVRSTAYYAPALVVFVGGDNFRLGVSSGNVGGVAWFPLAPREVYRPSYSASRSYFENVNRSNTVINTTVINNSYNTYNTTNVTNVTNVVYANRQVPGAVVAVPTTTFVQSQPVSKARVRLSGETLLASAPMAVAPRVAPTVQSVRGAASLGDKPPPRVFERPVVARTAPPAAHVGFVAQQQQLTAHPGKPLDDAARKVLKPAAAAPMPVVRVLTPAKVAPTKAPPPVLAASRPVTSQPQAVPQQAKPAVPPTLSNEQRGKADQRGNGQQRAQPVVTPPPSQRVTEPKPIAPRIVPSAPATPTPTPTPTQRLTQPRPASPSQVARPPAQAPAAKQLEPLAPVAVPKTPPLSPQIQKEPKADQRGQAQQRAQPVAPPSPASVQRPVEPKPVAPQVAPPPAARQIESRPPVAAPKPPPPQIQAEPRAESRGQAQQRGNEQQRAQPIAPPSPAPVQRAPESKPVAPPAPAPAARQVEPRPPVTAPRPPPPQPQSTPQADKRGQKPMPAASKPNEGESGRDASKRGQENDQQKR